ncbi:MAG TPA: hypothetical protein VKM55_16670 [Candidatus Lokiarchaeia archaeon]|nr:hypothetical protein [Candidatus Lokiarchaeia archaeon]
MGVEMAVGLFIDDRNFVPTKQQLVGVAAILQDVGILDDVARNELENQIETLYPESDGLVVVKGKESDVISYKINGSAGFPFFQSSFYKTKDMWEILDPELLDFIDQDSLENHDMEMSSSEPNVGGSGGQTLQIFKEEYCMQPIEGGRFTRFVIAHLYLNNYSSSWIVETNRKMKNDTVLAGLRSRLEELLGVKVISEILFY